MNKMLALLLCLALCFTLACAETTTSVQLVTVDFGDFTMDLQATDLLQQGEKVDNSTLAIIHPNYDAAETFHDNITIAWMSTDITSVLTLLGAESYAEMVMESAKTDMAAQGMAVSDATLLNVAYENNQMLIMYAITVDYSGMGYDLVLTLYVLQAYAMDAELGTYLFNVTTDTAEDLLNLTAYIDSVAFKTAEAAQ